MKVQLISFERESKQLQKSLLLAVNVHVAVKNKKAKDEIICVERLSSINFEKKHKQKTVETKPVFFLEKAAVF